MNELHNWIGFAGTAMIIIAYLMLQLEKLSISDLSYSLLNLFGAAAIIVSLCFEPNLPSFVIEGFWVLISLIGVWKFFVNRRSVEESI